MPDGKKGSSSDEPMIEVEGKKKMKKQVTFCEDEEVLDLTEGESQQNKRRKPNENQKSANSKINKDMDDLQQQINRAEHVMRGLNQNDKTNIQRSLPGRKKSKYALFLTHQW